MIPAFTDRGDGSLEARFEDGTVVILMLAVARTRVQAYPPSRADKSQVIPMTTFRKHAYQRAALQAFLSDPLVRTEQDRDGDLWAAVPSAPTRGLRLSDPPQYNPEVWKEKR